MKTNVQTTSIFAYMDLKDLGARQKAVYNTLLEGSMCNLEIAHRLGIPINAITPRTNELASKGLVEEKFKAPGPTGKTVIYWGIKEGTI